jgi:aldehyde:ferredoxin oxidoreductase
MKARGYMGKILRINLTTGVIETQELDDKLAEEFIGGSGLGAKILYDETTVDTEPFSEDNPIIFATGPLTGTKVFNSDRFDVVSRSPLTGIFGESSAGGFWGGMLKRCGFDALVVKGRSENPVYLNITEDKAEILPAGDIWGKDTFESTDYLKEKHGEKVKAAVIGQAGENLVRIAGMITDGHHGRAVGRAGMGAVMGWKRLKGVVVFGEKKTEVADPEALADLMKELGSQMKDGPEALRFGGTSVGVEYCDEIGNIPIKNWYQGGWPEGAAKISGTTMANTVLKGRYHCGRCVINCGRIVEGLPGPNEGKEIAGPEYETVGLMGTNLLIDDLNAVIKSNELCNRYGLDTISTGSVIGFAMEAYEKGLISKKQLDGIDLTWGSSRAVHEYIRKIAEKDGFGAVLGKGVKRAADYVGGTAHEFALEVKGLEPPAHDPRAKFTVALGYATSNRGACHVAAFTHDFEEGAYLEDLGTPRLEDRFGIEHKAENVYYMQHLMGMFDSLVACKFGMFGGLTVNPLIRALNAVTGWDFDREKFFRAGERIFNIKRLYNVRLGITRKDDVIPVRMLNQRRGGGTNELPPLNVLLDEYYKLRGWNEFGIPTEEKLEELSLA